MQDSYRRTCITIQWAVGCRVTHEGHDCLTDAVQGPGWTPGSLQDIQADLSGLETEQHQQKDVAITMLADWYFATTIAGDVEEVVTVEFVYDKTHAVRQAGVAAEW